jgi:hypothetical protein
MKLILITFISLLISISIFAQTNFSKGYNDGYKVGYCYDKKIECISPIIKTIPLPYYFESYDSYYDGYNRGIIEGAKEKELKLRQENFNQVRSNSAAFEISYGGFDPVLYNPDFSYLQNSSKKIQNENSSTLSSKDKQFIKKTLDEAQDPSNQERKLQFWKLNRTFYNSIKNYPQRIPDGWHKVIIYSGKEESEEKFKYTTIRQNSVLVENNRITTIAYNGDTNYMESWIPEDFNKFINELNPGLQSYIEKSYDINNGRGEIIEDIVIKENNGTYKLASDIDNFKSTKIIYFNEYLSKYENAQNCFNEIDIKYNAIKVHPKIQNGWHIVYVLDRIDACLIRNVYVENGKITIYKNGAGKEFKIKTGGIINQGKSNISYDFIYKNGNVKEMIFQIYFF